MRVVVRNSGLLNTMQSSFVVDIVADVRNEDMLMEAGLCSGPACAVALELGGFVARHGHGRRSLQEADSGLLCLPALLERRLLWRVLGAAQRDR